jgi:hypothetical protein
VGDRAGDKIGRERSGKSLQRAGAGLIYSSLRTSVRGGGRSKSGSKSGSRNGSRNRNRNRNRRTCGTGLRLANIWRYKGRGRRDLRAKREVLRVEKRDPRAKRRDLRIRRYL